VRAGDGGLDPEALVAALAAAGARGLAVEPIEPTLEDVFLEVARGARPGRSA
jgi:hypothetical protein